MPSLPLDQNMSIQSKTDRERVQKSERERNREEEAFGLLYCYIHYGADNLVALRLFITDTVSSFYMLQ
jgi:hypothetical protein